MTRSLRFPRQRTYLPSRWRCLLGRRSDHIAPASYASSAITHTLQGPIHSMTIVHFYAGAVQASGTALNLGEPDLVSRCTGTHYPCCHQSLLQQIRRSLFKHCPGPGAGHWCSLPCNYFLRTHPVTTVALMARSISSPLCSLGSSIYSLPGQFCQLPGVCPLL